MTTRTTDADSMLRRTRVLTEVFAWFTAVGAVGAVTGDQSFGPLNVVALALIVVVLGWWASRRASDSWLLVVVESGAILLGALSLPSPEPMLGFLFGVTTRRAVRNELGPHLLHGAPPLASYLIGVAWRAFGDAGIAPNRLGPSLMPIVGLVVGTLALRATLSAVAAARAAAREAALTNERLGAILRASPVALVALGPDLTVRMCNDQARELFGWSSDGDQVVPCPHSSRIIECPHGCLDLVQRHGVGEWTYRVDGGTRTVSVHVSDVAEGEKTGVLLAFVDISVRKELEDRLRHQAERDHLTNTVGRSHFTELLRAALREPGKRLALLLIDLDDFKDVNDAHGHPTGDVFLVAAAGQVRKAAATAGVVGRLGGDEFAVLAVGHDEDMAVELGERILAQLAATGSVAGRPAAMRASIGIALAPSGDGDDPAAVLLRDADTAMYVAKRAGGNRVQLFHQRIRATMLARQRDETELRQALAAEQFELYFQPIVDLGTEAVVSAEALIRWRHPERGLLPPGPVVELAEETGLILPLGNWALSAACRHAADWAARGIVIGTSVNVSARQLYSPDFVDIVAATLVGTGLPADLLTLELTESALARPSALDVLRSIQELGVRIALDDFGTGYSSLSYLQRHPFDVIKVDRSFTSRIGELPNAEGIVRCILQLADVLEIPVVGEGVETRAQAEFLAASGCARAQGYFFGKPAPADELSARLLREAPSAASRGGVTR